MQAASGEKSVRAEPAEYNKGRADMKKKRKERSGELRYPIPAMLLMMLVLWLFSYFVCSLATSAMGVGYTGLQSPDQKTRIVSDAAGILSAFMVLFYFRFRWRGKIQDFFQVRQLGTCLLMGWSIFVVEAITIFFNIIGGVQMGNFGLALLFGCAPGIREEVFFRLIPIAMVMRAKDKRKMMWIAYWTSTLVFSLIHSANILVGADPVSTLIQVFYAFGVGLIFAAIYLRTGNLWAGMILHSFTDFVNFTQLSAQQDGGVLSAYSTTEQVILIGFGILYLVNAIYIFRKNKREEVITSWERKWKPEEEQCC